MFIIYIIAIIVGLIGGLVAGWFMGYEKQVLELINRVKPGAHKDDGYYSFLNQPAVKKTTIAEDLAEGMDEIELPEKIEIQPTRIIDAQGIRIENVPEKGKINFSSFGDNTHESTEDLY